MGADGVRTGVQSLPGQLLTEPDDLVLDCGGDRVRAAPRSSRASLVGSLTLGVPAPDQLLDPVPGDVVVAGDLALGASLDDHGGDDESVLGHATTSRRGANYVPRQVPTMSWNQTLAGGTL